MFIFCRLFFFISMMSLLIPFPTQAMQNSGEEKSSATSVKIPKVMSQQELRDYLKTVVLPQVSAADREEAANNSAPFFIPVCARDTLEQARRVLEVGPGPCGSLRAFGGGKEVHAVEPDLRALSLAFDSEWTQACDTRNLHLLSQIPSSSWRKQHTDITWFINNLSPQWIPEGATLFHTTLEGLPSNLDNTYDLIVYKDVNLEQDTWEQFYHRLAHLLKPEGTVVLQFCTCDYYNPHETMACQKTLGLETVLRKNFGGIEEIIDTDGHEDVESKSPLIVRSVPDDVRFLILRNPVK